ncbi:SusD/RagB family nutrient-binding outer membrane lipoprotein [Gillisia sp. Q332]|uniref:SusD/RagB family nutrient-binding outer membrane lipoprotein n=1 Tax=Gillisia xinjiangensis TaxID=3384765 RepID=UPI00391B6632
MMKNIYKIKLIILSLLFFTSCTDGFEDMNVDSNLPTEANSGTLLPSSIFGPLNPHLNVQMKLTDQIMQYKVYRNENELDAYDFASGIDLFSKFWSAAYKGMRDSNESIAYGQANGLNAYVGAGKTLNAFYLASLTELWIDVPYSQALKGLDNVQPVYDKQQDIYPQVLNLLEEANTAFDSDTEGFVLGGDILFEGDVLKWRKMANSLRLRYLLRLSNNGSIDAANQIKTIVSDPSTYPIIASNAEAAIYDFTGVAPNTSDFSLLSALGGLSPSERFVSMLDGVNPTDDADDDPRLAFFADKPIDPSVSSGPFVGVESGTTREVAQGTGGNAELFASQFTTKFQDNKGLLDFVFISYAEVQFILAEARLNNWISTSTAKSYYDNGIAANLAYWNLAMPENFLTRPDVAWDGTLPNLINQKWKAMFFNNTLSMWGTHKRTGLPNLVPGSLATTFTDGLVPTRVFYPTLEQSVNSSNYQAAASNIGGDIITAKHWYQN